MANTTLHYTLLQALPHHVYHHNTMRYHRGGIGALEEAQILVLPEVAHSHLRCSRDPDGREVEGDGVGAGALVE